MKPLFLTILLLLSLASSSAFGGDKITLTLERAIKVANDSSLASFKNQNLYASGYWEWRTFKANRLPSLSLSVTPASYYRYITQRYDSQENIDVFRSQQTYSASAGLSAYQNVDFLGGSLYLQSDLEYLRNFGAYTYHQFSTVPVRLGYRQDLIGYNPFRWEKRIEPLKYEKAKREFIFNMETVSQEVVEHFFTLALAQTEYNLAVENLTSADTLYTVGERRFAIAAISQADLLTLRLDKVNARNTLENANIDLKRAQFSLASYLGLDTDTEIEVVMPGKPAIIDIPVADALQYALDNNPTLMARRQAVLEAERDVNKTLAESRFNASVNASIGFNQVAPTLGGAYSSLQRQDLVSVSVSVPLIDWGVRKGKYNMARNTLNVARIEGRQEELSVEQDVTMTLSDFSSQQRLVESAVEALDLADAAYAQTRQRFIIGKADINSLTLSHNRQQEASRNYISSLKNYWLSYYKIRRLTLFDFELHLPISVSFDNALGVR
ncbi:MAG: TolC family protein [Muribaculaceae bacterium]|nr:TolC family protein [Muribaculaceae bacterium]